MASLSKNLREHWISATLYLVMSIFFLGAAVSAASTYSAIVKAQQDVVLQNASSDVQELDNGSVEFTFTIKLDNPTRYMLHMSTVRWSVSLQNNSTGPVKIIPLASSYTGPTQFITVGARSSQVFSYDVIVSDPELLGHLHWYINNSKTASTPYTIESAPYVNEFRLIAYVGEFKHDYLREEYLNDLVVIDVAYTSGGAP